MAEDAGSIYAELRVNLADLRKDINDAKKQFASLRDNVEGVNTKLEGSFGSLGKTINAKMTAMSKTGVAQFAKLAAGINKAFMALPIIGLITMVAGAITKLVKGIGQWLEEGRQAYQAHQIELQKMNAVLQSTGATAWTSTRQLAEQARQLEINSRFAQNEIMAMQSVLLGFRSVTGSVFEETSEAIINMATVMGGDLASNARRVGQALEDPVDGLRMLARQGVIFTDTQRQLIKSFVDAGDHASAQRVIIDEMNRSFGGAAAAVAEVTAAQDRYAQAVERLRRAEGELTRGVGDGRYMRRAARRERRADRAEARIAERDARQRARSGYEEHMLQLENLRAKLADVSDEWDQTFLQDQAVRLELELDLTKAQDSVVLMERRLRDLVNAGGSGAQILRLREQIAAQNELAEGIREQIDLQGEKASANAQRIALERNETESLIEVEERLAEIHRAREQTMREIERAGRAALAAGREEAAVREEMNARIMATYAQEKNAVNNLISSTENLNITSARGIENRNRLLAEFNGNLVIAAENVQRLYETIRYEGNAFITAPQLQEQINIITDERRMALNRIADHLTYLDAVENTSIQNTEEREQRRIQLIQQRLQAEQSASSAIAALFVQERIALAGNPGFYRQLQDTVNRTTKVQRELTAEQERAAEAARNTTLQYEATKGATEALVQKDRQLRLERARIRGDLAEIRDIENEIAMAKLEQASHFKYLLAGLQEGTAEWNAALDLQRQLTESVQTLRQAQASVNMAQTAENYETRLRTLTMTTRQAAEAQRQLSLQAAEAFRGIDGFDELVEGINGYYDELKRRDAWQQFSRNAAWAMGQVQQLVGAIQQVIANTLRQTTENQREQLDQRHADLVAALEEEQQARLFSAGLAQAATEIQHTEELARAKATGNHRLILEAQTAKQRFEIENEIAERKKELERETALERARIDYEYAKAQWRMQKTQAKLSAAQAILTALSSAPWPWNLIPIGFATGIGAAKVAAVHQNRPQFQLPKFASGGIVPGNSFVGDKMVTLQNSGEMDITRQQQKWLWDAISNNQLGNTETGPINLTLVLDGKTIAKNTIDRVNRREYLIDMRSVK